jgi:ribonuclease HI
MEKQLSIVPQPPSATLQKVDKWLIHIDGAARGNPGPAAAGVFIEREGLTPIKEGIYLGEKTNNQAEYIALAYALFLVEQHRPKDQDTTQIKLIIYSDSQLLVRQIIGLYKVKNESLASIKKNIDYMLYKFSHTISHVMRENNKEADKIANIAVDKKIKIPTDFLKILANCGFKRPV